LLALGGDGTFQSLVNAVSGLDAVLGILPAGGGNDFAAALQLPKDTVEAAKAILSGQLISVDLARARTADGHSRLYVGGGGVGIDAEAAQYAGGAFRRLPGRSRYVAAALRALRSYRPIGVRLEFPGSETPAIEARVMLGAVLNTPTYGAGIKLAPDAQISDGWLDAVIVEDLNWREVLRVLPKLIIRGELRTPRVKRVKAKTVRLSTERPAEFHGDGEVLGPTPVEIEVVPQGARVLAPKA
jgi:diacylglycerol kinase (ATP)